MRFVTRTALIGGCLLSANLFAAQGVEHTLRVNVSDEIHIVSNIPTTIEFNVDDTNYTTAQSLDYEFMALTTSNNANADVKLQLLPDAGEYDDTSTWVNMVGVPPSESTRVYYTIEYTACGLSAPTYDLSDSNGGNGAAPCPNHTCTIPHAHADIDSCSNVAGRMKITRNAMNAIPPGGAYEGTFTFVASET